MIHIIIIKLKIQNHAQIFFTMQIIEFLTMENCMIILC